MIILDDFTKMAFEMISQYLNDESTDELKNLLKYSSIYLIFTKCIHYFICHESISQDINQSNVSTDLKTQQIKVINRFIDSNY